MNAPLARFKFLQKNMGRAHTHLFGKTKVYKLKHMGTWALLACLISFVGLFLLQQGKALRRGHYPNLGAHSAIYRCDIGPHFDSALVLGKTILLYLEGRLPGTTFPPQKARHFEKQNAHSKMLAFCFFMFSCDTHRVSHHTHQVSQKKIGKKIC